MPRVMDAVYAMTTETEKLCGLAPVPTLVVGLGKTGLSCVRFLAACGMPLAVTDSRTQPPALAEMQAEFGQLPLELGGFSEQRFLWAQRLVVSPGISLQQPLIAAARARGVEVMGDIELFARAAQAPVVAVTGSNGKSTVTLLLAEMARAAGREVRMGGNIGTPALELLAAAEPDFYVLELSSFQLDTTQSLDAKAAVVLNVSADHMDRYPDLAGYAASKQQLFAMQTAAGDVMVINRDDPLVNAMTAGQQRRVSFGLGAPEGNNYGRRDEQSERYLVRGEQRLLPVSALTLTGEHNQANALAALALGEAMGLPMTAMLSCLRSFTGLPHRMQFVADIAGVRWINDSKGTNVGATLAAIQGLAGPLILIAGGQGKGADFSPLREAMGDKVRAVVLLGEDAAQIAQVVSAMTDVQFASDMDDAVRQAQALARAGDTVLLSPACASFDMFNGFEQRGDVFMQVVHTLAAGANA
jgi:UDP-N-acetylmuramoylalanine--D-glutamate ligase